MDELTELVENHGFGSFFGIDTAGIGFCLFVR